MVLGLASLVLTTWSTDGHPVMPGFVLGAVAGVFFAIMFIVSADTSVDSGIWPMTSQRLVAARVVTGFSLARGCPRSRHSGPRDCPSSVASRAAPGGSAVILGGQRHPLGPIAVTASLYPAVAITLMWLFFGERLRWWQVAGLAGALTGVALIAAD